MPRLRILGYALVAAAILVCSLLWSGVIASPASNGNAAPLWGEGPTASIPVPIDLTVHLQRPNSPAPSAPWAVPVTLSFYTPGSDPLTVPSIVDYTVTLGNDGKWSGNFTLEPGVYDVRIRNLHTLRNVKESLALNSTANAVDMGTLLEGDANASNSVGSPDFVLLRNAYFTNQSDPACTPPVNPGDPPCWDPRADFDEDNRIRSSDFSLMSLNYFKSGDITLTAPAARTQAGAATMDAATMTAETRTADGPGGRIGKDAFVGLTLLPRVVAARPGRIVDLTLTALAGEQPFVAADATILFPPDALQVVDAQGQPATGVEVQAPFAELINQVDNQAGKILVGVGSFEGPLSGDVPLAKMHFKVLKPGAMDVAVVDCTVADQNGKWVTGPLTGARVVGQTRICIPVVSKAP